VREDQTKNLILGGLVSFFFLKKKKIQMREGEKEQTKDKLQRWDFSMPLLILKEERNEELLRMLPITEWKVALLATEC
jgi:hypothetical protein